VRILAAREAPLCCFRNTQVPQLQVIVAGLVEGMGSITYIAALLFLVYYIFGIVSVLLFKRNDPFNFGTLPIAIYTLFRISTLDGWTDTM
jgi:voltage-gated sodium channel